MRTAAYGAERKGDMQRPVDDATTTSMNQVDLLELGVFKSKFASSSGRCMSPLRSAL